MTAEACAEPRHTRQNPTEPAYLSWCLVVRNCEATLEATLKSLRALTPDAELVVVDTCSSDRTPEIAQRYADVWEVYRGPRGDWNEEMPAVDDMAAARQRSFERATGIWRGWADGDDRVVGGQEAQDLLRLNGRWEPQERDQQVDSAEEPQGLEDELRRIAEGFPDVTMLTCPYLYRRDEHNHAVIWQQRERFVRWEDPPRFRWSEAAHEVLVPVPGYLPPKAVLSHLLWVHEKKFTPEEVDYSVRRHYAIMLRQYEQGDITHRRARYLANFAAGLAPERVLEFLRSALSHAWTSTDRYRARVALGDYYAKRGLYWESQDNHRAAANGQPDWPDAWYAGGMAAFNAEDFGRAVTWFRRGTKCELVLPHSEVNPRDHVVKWPVMLSEALQRLAQQYVDAYPTQGEPALATAAALCLEASQVLDGVVQRDEIGVDLDEAKARFRRAYNAYQGQRTVIGIRQAWAYLRANDEPQKALALTDAFPWNAETHPFRHELTAWARTVRRHIQSDDAYREFYRDDQATGYRRMASRYYTYEHAHPRVQWVVDWIQANAPKARVLDLGCCDGIVGIPLLLTCPDVTYHGVDVNPTALEAFGELLEEFGIVGELLEEFGIDTGRVALESGRWPKDFSRYDVVVAGEIIEHVPNAYRWLVRASGYLAESARLLLTTPWGAYDDGLPPPETCHGTPRTDLGHLRAYTPQALHRDLAYADCKTDDLKRLALDEGGDAMVAVARREPPGQGTPVAFAVAGALWKWNGSRVEAEGIGASEETIIRLGERLAPSRDVRIYGPVPQGEVHRGVAYFQQGALGPGVWPHAKLVVSRAPGYVRRVDDLVGRELSAVLWLQDTHYPDLDAETAERYEAIVCVSEWHRQHTAEVHGVPLDKIRVAYNFLLPHEFEAGVSDGWPLKKRDHFIYASSPDRGLIRLLELWPRIREVAPEATLSVFYGWRGAQRLAQGHDAGWNKRYLTSRRRYEELRHQPGVQEVGLVNHQRIALEYQRAGCFAYPTDFHETGCLSIVKARAGGAVPVTSALAALKETGRCSSAGTLIEVPEDGAYPEGYDDLFIEGVRAALEVSDWDRKDMALEALANFSIDAVLPVWEGLLA